MTIADDGGIPARWGLTALLALIAIAIVPPWVCVAFGGGSLPPIAAGAAIWAGSVLAKRGILVVFNRAMVGFRATALRAALHGFISAAAELAAAGFYLLHWPPASFADVVGFGIGAGSLEAVYVLTLSVWGAKPTAAQIAIWADGAARSLCVRYMVPIERFFALIGHVGARGLIYIGLNDGGLNGGGLKGSGIVWLGVACLLFTAIDGVAVYGHLQRWPWTVPRVCRRAHLFFAATSLVEAALFVAAFPAGR